MRTGSVCDGYVYVQAGGRYRLFVFAFLKGSERGLIARGLFFESGIMFIGFRISL